MLHRNFISHVLAFIYDHYPYCIPDDTLVVQTSSQQKLWYSHLESRVSKVIYDVWTGMIYKKQAFDLTLNHLKFGFPINNCVP